VLTVLAVLCSQLAALDVAAIEVRWQAPVDVRTSPPSIDKRVTGYDLYLACASRLAYYHLQLGPLPPDAEGVVTFDAAAIAEGTGCWAAVVAHTRGVEATRWSAFSRVLSSGDVLSLDRDLDGVDDLDEMANSGSHPLVADSDADGVEDSLDNCPLRYNPGQEDVFGLGSVGPDGVADVCQCGEITDDDQIDVIDVIRLRNVVAGVVTSNPTVDDRCSLAFPQGECGMRDIVILRRALDVAQLGPGVAPSCAAAFRDLSDDVDSDGDGIHDAAEAHVLGTLLISADTDGNGDTDLAESRMPGSGVDTDDDGLTDDVEIDVIGSDPNDPDTDDDTLDDGSELLAGTDPFLPDSDFDGLSDGVEVAQGTHPLEFDSDGDLVPDAIDNCPRSWNPDQGSSGGPSGDICFCGNLPDYEGYDTVIDEVDAYELRLALTKGGPFPPSCSVAPPATCDMLDAVILRRATADPPLGPGIDSTSCKEPVELPEIQYDTDGDTLPDWLESSILSSRFAADTDGDLLTDWAELFLYGTSPSLADTDGDGADDQQEMFAGTDPLDASSVAAVPALGTAGLTLLAGLLLLSIGVRLSRPCVGASLSSRPCATTPPTRRRSVTD